MKWEKYAKICVKMLKNRLPLFLQHSLYLPMSRSKTISHVSGFQKYLFFPLEQIFLELFSLGHHIYLEELIDRSKVSGHRISGDIS